MLLLFEAAQCWRGGSASFQPRPRTAVDVHAAKLSVNDDVIAIRERRAQGMTTACPRCKSAYVTEGKFLGERGKAYAFIPSGLRFWTLRAKAAPLPSRGLTGPNAYGCAACGLVWSETDPEKIRRALRGAGTEETRKAFAGILSENDPPGVNDR
jgi:hypothetical protein